ncbi:hypothetical protein B6U80_01665 [Candidatus Pacearchaeota archaeon ex4484_26]|nr:MAG: hypothetical protein B6U80_01665 [Candidatus Pacearchaeota archaeon ex4484_26]
MDFLKNIKKNKKGILGSELATIWAIIILAIILIIFYMLASILGLGPGFGEKTKVIPEKAFMVEDSTEVIALLKTPFEIELDSGVEKVTLPLNEILKLYTMGEVSGDVVKEKIAQAFEKSYGICYAFRYEPNFGSSEILEERWILPKATNIEMPETIIFLPYGKFYFRNLYNWNKFKGGVSNLDAICQVKR